MYKFEKSIRIIDKILEENNYSRILRQFPDGLLGEFCTKIVNQYSSICGSGIRTRAVKWLHKQARILNL